MSAVLDISVQKRFDGFKLSMTETIALSGITAIFGPSGSGKSTLLRLIAGFEIPDQGHIKVDTTDWTHLKPHTRHVGYMRQNAGLFPHLTVEKNLRFADTRSDGSRYSLDDIVEAFDLHDLLIRAPKTLSGGETQRVALARTLLTRPHFLMLDEPLAGLERARKRTILPFIKLASVQFNLPCLYVSHDVETVSLLSDHIILLRDGRVTGRGPTPEVISRLDTGPLLGTAEISTLYAATITHIDPDLHLTTVHVGNAELILPTLRTLPTGASTRLHILAKDVAIATHAPTGLSTRNTLSATITDITSDTDSPFANLSLHLTEAPNAPDLRARITRAAVAELNLSKGRDVFALIKSVSFAHALL